MKIGILSRKASLYSTARLKEAARQRGHEVRIVDYLRVYMNITSHKPIVMYGGETLDVDAIIPRIGASQTFYGTAVVRQFEMAGVYSANESQAIARSRDKLRCLQLLARAGIGLPVTTLAKGKTGVQMGALGALLAGNDSAMLLGIPWLPVQIIGEAMLFAAAALTLVTGWDYLTTGLHHASQAQRASAPVRE